MWPILRLKDSKPADESRYVARLREAWCQRIGDHEERPVSIA
jgi:hypothetical protein